jgi:hypothetical protein
MLFFAIRAALHNQIPKILKKFSPSLTPYFTTTYDYSSCSSCLRGESFFAQELVDLIGMNFA